MTRRLFNLACLLLPWLLPKREKSIDEMADELIEAAESPHCPPHVIGGFVASYKNGSVRVVCKKCGAEALL